MVEFWKGWAWIGHGWVIVNSVRWRDGEGKLTKEIVHYYIVSIINYKEEINILHISKCVEDCNEIYVIKIWSSLIKVNKIINKKINSSNLKLNY